MAVMEVIRLIRERKACGSGMRRRRFRLPNLSLPIRRKRRATEEYDGDDYGSFKKFDSSLFGIKQNTRKASRMTAAAYVLKISNDINPTKKGKRIMPINTEQFRNPALSEQERRAKINANMKQLDYSSGNGF